MNFIKKIFSYFSVLIAECKTDSPKFKFRIEGIDEKTMQIIIKIVGKNMIFKSAAQQLVEDSNIIHDFSYDDVKTIFRYFYNVEPSYQIVEIIIDDNNFSVNIAYKKRGAKKTEIKPPNEIIANKELLYSFPPKDIRRICIEAKNI